MSMQTQEIPFVKEMFNKIAHRYDLLNRLLSLKQDVLWRKALVGAMDIPQQGRVLDVACGTGDVPIEIISRTRDDVLVFGIDFSAKMLEIAREKINVLPHGSKIHLICGNAFALPFLRETFNAVTIAFGIRNISDKKGALKSFYKSMKSGGMIFILELTAPEKGLLLSVYLLYFQKILPLIGLFFSKNRKAYTYLPESVMNFPKDAAFIKIMRQAGFENIRYKKMTMGIATLYTGYKNSRPK